MVKDMSSNVDVYSSTHFPFFPQSLKLFPLWSHLAGPNAVQKLHLQWPRSTVFLGRPGPQGWTVCAPHTHTATSVCVGRLAYSWTWDPQEGTDLAQRSTCSPYYPQLSVFGGCDQRITYSHMSLKGAPGYRTVDHDPYSDACYFIFIQYFTHPILSHLLSYYFTQSNMKESGAVTQTWIRSKPLSTSIKI